MQKDSFLKIKLWQTGKLLLLIGFAWLAFGASIRLLAQQRYAYERGAMGSVFKLVFYAPNETVATLAADSVFRRIEYLNTVLSDYLDGSEVNRLSASAGTGTWVAVSPDLWQLLRDAQQWSQATHGAFDITVGPIVQLWRRALRRNYFPEKSEIKQAKRQVGYRKIKLNPAKKLAQLTVTGMRLDFGGIGKGYAADQSLQVLKHFGIHQALLDAGGDLALGAAPPGKDGWEIEVSSGGSDTTHRQVLSLAHCGVATSGATYRYLEHRGVRYSHIVNPRTGVGLTTHTRTTVIAPNGTAADALATAFSVLGTRRAKKIAPRLLNVNVWLIEQSGATWRQGI